MYSNDGLGVGDNDGTKVVVGTMLGDDVGLTDGGTLGGRLATRVGICDGDNVGKVVGM